MEVEPLKPGLLITLYKLAEFGAYPDETLVTTTELAKILNLSQQSASRHLIELEKLGLIARHKVTRGETIRITEGGVKQLETMFGTLKRVFEAPPKELILKGVVFSGLGEGAYYVGQEGYKKQFLKKLGFNPYPGTLNLRVPKEYAGNRQILDTFPFIMIGGFTDKTRSFGAVKCVRAKIEDSVDGAILIPVRTHYSSDVFELIAPVNLRRKLRLKDGDLVTARTIISKSRRASVGRPTS